MADLNNSKEFPSPEVDQDAQAQAFALQQLGQNLFEHARYEDALKCFYEAMMIRVRLGQHEHADSCRIAFDRTTELLIPPVTTDELDSILQDPRLPEFVPFVLGKRHADSDLPRQRSNCINAAMGFYSQPPYRFQTATTLEALEFLKTRFTQLETNADLEFGDLLVIWTRNGGTWDERKVVVSEMDTAAPDFPYGLIFEHIAVVVGDGLIFHKPNPSLHVPYRIDRLEAATIMLRNCKGFEVTAHREKF